MSGDLLVYQADTAIADLEIRGAAQGSGRLFVGQSSTYGGGISYNGDDNPSMVGGTDKITFFRRSSGTDTEVFSYSYSSNTVTFAGDVTISGTASIDGTTFEGCPSGWYSAAGGRICMSNTEYATATAHNAIGTCKALEARVCTHNDFQQICGTGVDPYTSGTGWYGDHARVETDGNTDDEFLTWNSASCANNNDGAAYVASTSFPYRCCW